jgi:hypothetical protein
VQRTASGAAGNGLGTMIKYLRRIRNGAANTMVTMAKCLRRRTSGAAGKSLGTTIK